MNFKSRIKKEGLVCGETDKTGKLTLDTLENVVKKMDKHIKNDKVLNEKEVRKLENNLNRHMEFWVNILKPGEKNNQLRRVKSNLITKDSQIPILRGTSKDHKEADDKKAGPDVRPIMGAIVGPNIGLSEIGSRIVRKIADNADTGLVSKSTEEVLNKFEMYNKRRLQSNPGIRNLIVASMDIEKYYPNILSDKSAKIIRKMWEESDLSIEGIDYDKLRSYLGKHLKKEEIVEEGFEELLYKRKVKERKKKKKATKKIGKKYTKNKAINKRKQDNTEDNESLTMDNNETKDTMKNTSSGGDDTLDTPGIKKNRNDKKKKKKRTTEWTKPVRNPTKVKQRKLFGKALELLLTTCMDNHVYQFENQVRIQGKGGPIGLKLTGEIADCLMIDWDKQLLAKLKTSLCLCI